MGIQTFQAHWEKKNYFWLFRTDQLWYIINPHSQSLLWSTYLFWFSHSCNHYQSYLNWKLKIVILFSTIDWAPGAHCTCPEPELMHRFDGLAYLLWIRLRGTSVFLVESAVKSKVECWKEMGSHDIDLMLEHSSTLNKSWKFQFPPLLRWAPGNEEPTNKILFRLMESKMSNTINVNV